MKADLSFVNRLNLALSNVLKSPRSIQHPIGWSPPPSSPPHSKKAEAETLHIMQNTKYNACNTMPGIQCIKCRHSIKFMELNAWNTMHGIQFIRYTALNTMHKMQCIEYNEENKYMNTMHRIQCMEFNAWNTMHGIHSI